MSARPQTGATRRMRAVLDTQSSPTPHSSQRHLYSHRQHAPRNGSLPTPCGFPCALGLPCRLGTILRGAAAGLSPCGGEVPGRRISATQFWPLAGSLRFVALHTEQSGAKATNRSNPGASSGNSCGRPPLRTATPARRARPGEPGRASRGTGPGHTESGQMSGYAKGADSGWAAETESPVRSVSPRKKPGLVRYMMSISTAPSTITPIPRTNTSPTPPTEEPEP